MNVALAKICCKLCQYAYRRMVGGETEPALLVSCGVMRETFQREGTISVMLLELAERRIIVFPGTESEWEFVRTPGKTYESIQDWVKNAKFKLTSGATLGVGGRIHHGFCSEIMGLMPLIESALDRHISDFGSKPLVITGHSQGAAEAAIAAGVLTVEGHDVEQAITFAAPRPGDSDFAAWMADRGIQVWRCEYGDDFVPHVPISIGGVESLDFEHVGQLVYGSPNNATVIVQHSPNLLWAKRIRNLHAHVANWAEHHHLPHYLQMLEDFPCDS